MKSQENIDEIITIEERRMDMMEGVGKEHIYESPKNIESHPIG